MLRDGRLCIDCGATFYGRAQVGLERCRPCFQAFCCQAVHITGEEVTADDEAWFAKAFAAVYGQDDTPLQRRVTRTIPIDLIGKVEASALRIAQRKLGQVTKVRKRSYARSEYDAIPQCCVYVVQVLNRKNTVKIGHTKAGRQRLRRLPQEYGPIHVLLVIPHANPALLERMIHTQLARYRLYEEASSSELFCFSPRQGYRILQRLCQHYNAIQLQSPLWETATQDKHTLGEEQLILTL